MKTENARTDRAKPIWPSDYSQAGHNNQICISKQPHKMEIGELTQCDDWTELRNHASSPDGNFNNNDRLHCLSNQNSIFVNKILLYTYDRI